MKTIFNTIRTVDWSLLLRPDVVAAYILMPGDKIPTRPWWKK